MDVILIPGFWLDASSWQEVTPALLDAGHTVHTLTLPGLESRDADRSGITLGDHVTAVVSAIDSLEGPVALVGHSGGGGIASLAADARVDRVAHVVYVDSGPLGDGDVINDAFEVENGEIPLPEWGAFDDEELGGLTPELRERMRARAIPQPAAVASDAARPSNPRRYDVPTTVIASTMTSDVLERLIADRHAYIAEFARMKNRTIVDLPTGHWPQFTRPDELGVLIVRALA